MAWRGRSLRYAVASLLLASLVACSSDDEPDADPTPTPSGSATSSAPPTSPTAEPTEAQTSGGPVDAPVKVAAETDLLDWRPVDGPVDDTVTRNEDWTLTVSDDGATWKLAGPAAGGGGRTAGWQVSDTMLDEDWAVVVLQDETEQQPSRAVVTELATGKSYSLNGTSDIPTTNGGAWALGEGRVLHATVDGGAYCLASVDLASRTSTVAWCAPKRTGFNSAHISPAGDSILTFDDARTACRTAVTVADGTVTPFEGVPDCKAFEGIAVDDGAIWSVIPREQRVEESHLYARVGEGYLDLGQGSAGTLTWCDDAAYFVRDPLQRGASAALLRWSPEDGLAVVYESPKGEAFLETPRCGGDTMTVTALTSSGDEQVSADL